MKQKSKRFLFALTEQHREALAALAHHDDISQGEFLRRSIKRAAQRRGLWRDRK